MTLTLPATALRGCGEGWFLQFAAFQAFGLAVEPTASIARGRICAAGSALLGHVREDLPCQLRGVAGTVQQLQVLVDQRPKPKTRFISARTSCCAM